MAEDSLDEQSIAALMELTISPVVKESDITENKKIDNSNHNETPSLLTNDAHVRSTSMLPVLFVNS